MRDRSRRNSPTSDIQLSVAELDERIAAVRENIRDLTEQATAYSGAADEELTARRIVEQEAELEILTKRRNELSSQKP